MLIYLYWPQGGNAHIQAFHKLDKAVSYVIDQIEELSFGNIPKSKRKYSTHLNDNIMVPPPRVPLPFFEMDRNLGGGPKDTQEKKGSSELSKLRNHLVVAKKTKNIENAIKAITLFEEYSKYILCSESAIHTLQDIRIVE